ncbi:MAG: GNAT family N-acetyltransferase [Salana multivorans]|nr:GNAT family N-acetyltransferase [Salana multivorans]
MSAGTTTVAPRVDVVTIFPEYLAPLELSLIGKARVSGLVDLRVHDLREHAHDRHRTVDDAPLGGGAGMVMKPDVWFEAVEAVVAVDPRDLVVLVPTPSGTPLTQAVAARLAVELGGLRGDHRETEPADRVGPDGLGGLPGDGGDGTDSAGGPDGDGGPEAGRNRDDAAGRDGGPRVRGLVLCGRYEGIDARVVEELREHPRVREVVEFSLGDFVLNGGEVAAMALLEAVVRLLPGVLGNPESVVEESFGDASEPLLEYPVYTRPAEWNGRAVPHVLLSGHHAAIRRWRRDASLRRTAERRPDLVRRLDVARLDGHDREVLASVGVVVARDGRLAGPFTVERAELGCEAVLADVAAVTFPLACPDGAVLGDVRRHVAQHLSERAWQRHLSDPAHTTFLLRDADGTPSGFSLLLRGDAQGEDVRQVGVPPEELVELSKFYLLPRLRGTGAADALMTATLASVAPRDGRGLTGVWLGTNAGNSPAQRAYLRHGFVAVGTRTYRVGDDLHDDVVMLRRF